MKDTLTVVGLWLPKGESAAITYCIYRSHIMGRVEEFNYLGQKNISSHLKQLYTYGANSLSMPAEPSQFLVSSASK